jgi:upstream activation factor subunit UAF30
MTFDDETLYARNDDDIDEYGDTGYGDVEEDYEEEEEEEAEETPMGGSLGGETGAPMGGEAPPPAPPKKKAPARKKAARKKATKKPAKKKSTRKPSAAFMKPMQISAPLAAVIVSGPYPRTEVTKKLWAYIKKHGLQDSKNRRNINADEKLKEVFGGKKQVSMFDMTKMVSKHLK